MSKFLIIKISLTLLLISNEPVITALPENGNPNPLPFNAYDAVSAYDELNALVAVPNSDPVKDGAMTEPDICT